MIKEVLIVSVLLSILFLSSCKKEEATETVPAEVEDFNASLGNLTELMNIAKEMKSLNQQTETLEETEISN